MPRHSPDTTLMDTPLQRMKAMAKELQITERTLYDLMRRGMPYVQVARIIWFDREKVFNWLSKFERKRVSKNKGSRHQSQKSQPTG